MWRNHVYDDRNSVLIPVRVGPKFSKDKRLMIV